MEERIPNIIYKVWHRTSEGVKPYIYSHTHNVKYALGYLDDGAYLVKFTIDNAEFKFYTVSFVPR